MKTNQHIACLLLTLCCGVILGGSPLQAGHVEGTTDDFQRVLNIAVTVKIAKYVEWPTHLSDGVLHFCIEKDYLPYSSISPILRTKVQNRRLKYREFDPHDSELKGCDITFFHHIADSQLGNTIQQPEHSNILMVSDQKQFLQQGGMISLQQQDQRIEITINRTAVERSQLYFSALLYQLAQVFEEGDEEREGRR